MLKSVPVAATLLILAACSRTPQYYLDLANRQAAQGKYADAAINYRKAIQGKADFGEAYYQFALTELKMGKPQAAMPLLSEAVKLMPNRTDATAKLADVCVAVYISDRRHPKYLLDKAAEIAEDLV